MDQYLLLSLIVAYGGGIWWRLWEKVDDQFSNFSDPEQPFILVLQKKYFEEFQKIQSLTNDGYLFS